MSLQCKCANWVALDMGFVHYNPCYYNSRPPWNWVAPHPYRYGLPPCEPHYPNMLQGYPNHQQWCSYQGVTYFNPNVLPGYPLHPQMMPLQSCLPPSYSSNTGAEKPKKMRVSREEPVGNISAKREGDVKGIAASEQENNTLKPTGNKASGTPSTDEVWMIPRKKNTDKLKRPLRPLNLQFVSPQFYKLLLTYIPSKPLLLKLGYPVVSRGNPKCAMIFQNAYQNPKNSQKDVCSEVTTSKMEFLMRSCVRCGIPFYTSKTHNYLSTEKCTYHWAKLWYTGKDTYYPCCNDSPNSKGCTIGKLHVWSGLSEGFNAPLTGYVQPKPAVHRSSSSTCNIFGLDCEMCYTVAGLEVVRVTLMSLEGSKVFDCLVHPEHEVIDYNTRFSGISEADFIQYEAKSLQEAQKNLLEFINCETIIIGHGLENDFRAMKIIHTLVVDTAVIFPHALGLPHRRSLKNLAEEILDVTIQARTEGHDSAEDAKVCLSLVLEKLKQEHNVRIMPTV